MLRVYSKLARSVSTFGLAAAIALVAGCGGGGGGNGSSASSTSGGTSGNTSSSSGSNQTPVVVSSGVNGNLNIPMVSVTVCVHGTNTCQTIGNIQLDTGSFGLRLASDALSTSLLNALPTETVNSNVVAECFGFASGNSWGSVRTADVTLAGETASSVPIHILNDLPQSVAGGTNNHCASGTLQNTSQKLSAHGILGIGTAKYDCLSIGTSNCTSTGVANDQYYGCTVNGSGTVTSCTDLAAPLSTQVVNPIQRFPTDNNGVIVTMPAVSSTGAASAAGLLTFGIGTRSNNVLPTASIQKLTVDHFGSAQGASLSGTPVSYAFFDTGSNGLFFTDSTITPQCTGSLAGFYCPSSTVTRQPTVTGYNGTSTLIAVSIANAATLLSSGNFAYGNVGGQVSGLSAAFDFGLPFFYGRTVYLGYDQQDTISSGTGTAAFVAF